MTKTRKMLLECTFAFLIIVALQWLHFIFYFNQPVADSLIWSVVDWAVWFALLIGLLFFSAHNSRAKIKIRPFLLACCFIATAGVLQVIISSGIYYIIFDGDRALLDSIVRSLDKRWFQNITIASVMSLVANIILQRLSKAKTEGIKTGALKLFDGKSYHQVKQSDIVAICANKNYVSVFTADREIVVRTTLKELSEQLACDNIKQISRSAFVNSNAIDALHKYSRTSYRVMLSNQHELNVSKAYLNNIQGLLT